MKTILNFGWGGLLVLLGTGLLGWIGYNVFIDMQPEAEGRSPVKPAMFGIVMVGAGIARIRGRLRGDDLEVSEA